MISLKNLYEASYLMIMINLDKHHTLKAVGIRKAEGGIHWHAQADHDFENGDSYVVSLLGFEARQQLKHSML